LFLENAPQFDSTIYERIALNDLVIYAVYFLSQAQREITAEDIVACCFALFPKRFALRGYPQWPDSTVVNKRWIDCRNKELIIGSTKDGFSLTPKGQRLAERVGGQLRGDHASVMQRPSKTQTELRTRAGRFVRSLEESEAFKLYKRNKETSEISEFDFRSMLLCTLESSPDTLRNNLAQFSQHVALYGRDDLLGFLDFCKRKFAYILGSDSRESSYRGGMMRQKNQQRE
jgi:hypothetical protein